MKDTEQANTSTGNLSTGDVKGSALSTGHHNTQTVSYIEQSPIGDDQAVVLEALRNIRIAFDGISGPYANPAKRNAEAAVDAASTENLDKNEVGGALETALEAAKKSTDFLSVAAKIAPYVKTAAGWLGAGWGHLVSLIG